MLAAKHNFYFWLLLETLLGLALVIASACVYNNYLDRGIDKQMVRTSKRALVIGSVSQTSALIYATVLGVIGLAVLAAFTNWRVFISALVAIFFYVIVYGLAKRRSVHGTLVGSIPGAIPPVIGYLAVTNRVDSAAVILFLILVFWQMPHFYAISMYRYKDYKAAGLPVLAVKKGMAAARRQIILYIIGFIVAAASLTFAGYTGYIYLAAVLVLGLYWLGRGIQKYKLDDEKWGRLMFLTSLVVNLAISVSIALGGHLP